MFRILGYLVLGLGVAGGLTGCGGRGGGPATVPATGMVLFQGKPVEGAHVTFSPQAAGGHAAFARTDAEGRFTLMTIGGSGAVPGAYGVTVAKEVAEGGLTVEQSQAHFEKTGQSPPPPKVADQLPAKYKATKTSGLSATVEERGTNDFKFELTP